MSKCLILDITPLKNGYYQNSGRSGIFFTLKNILSEILQLRQEMDLYFNIICGQPDDAYKTLYVLQQEFPLDSGFVRSRCFSNAGFLSQSVNFIFAATESRKERLFGRCIRKALRLAGKAAVSQKWNVPAEIAEKATFLSLMYAVPEYVKKQIPPERCCTMLYDTIPSLFSVYSGDLTSWYGKVVSSLSANEKYLAISQSSVNDFKRLFPVVSDCDIDVVPLAAADSFCRVTDEIVLQKVRNKYSIPAGKRVFFSHCSLAPHKNLDRLFAAFCQIREQLVDWIIVFSGSNALGMMNKLLQYAADRQVPESSFVFTGYVDDEDLAALYSLADVFCFVSLYEGFGLPVLEAMSCGTACVVSNTSSIPEVAGDAALYADPERVEDIAQKMLLAAQSEELRNDYTAKSIARAKLFSWQKSSRMIVEKLDLI